MVEWYKISRFSGTKLDHLDKTELNVALKEYYMRISVHIFLLSLIFVRFPFRLNKFWNP